MKIVHVSNFSLTKNGEAFYSMDRKISAGLIRNGNFVYDFSYRDQAKFHRFLGFKKKSIEKMNRDLVQTCRHVRPHLLLLSKAEFVTIDTLKLLKTEFPQMKIAQWYVDFIEREGESFFKKFEYLDAFFQTSAAELESLSMRYPGLICSYMPNISDPAFENAAKAEKRYDVVYIARDHKEDSRYKFAVLLQAFCEAHGLKLKLYASLGQPPVFGQAYYDAIAEAKIAINFNRTDRIDGANEMKFMGSSDRMNHMMGVGTCLFSPWISGLEMLYKDREDLIYFDGFDDCGRKLLDCLESKAYERIGEQGRLRAFSVSNAQKVTQYMIETLMGGPYSQTYEWGTLHYQNGWKECWEN